MNAGAIAERLGWLWGVAMRETWDRFRIWAVYRVGRSFKTGVRNGRYPEGTD
jgi:hypothetical protein